MRSGQEGFSYEYYLHTAYSDTSHLWHLLPLLGVDEDHCAIAPLGNTTAIVVYAGQSGLAWAVVDGDHWGAQGVLDPRPWTAAHPRIRLRPSGGFWLEWTDRGGLYMRSYRDGLWSEPDSIRAVHPPGQTFVGGWCSVSRDPGERPVVVWSDLGYGYTYRDVVCIAFPTDTGWEAGEEVPGSESPFVDPVVARDLNGDVWVMWRVHGQTYNRWTHTYTSAMASVPQAFAGHGGVSLHWTLSAPAPASRWTVLRDAGEGRFDSLATVTAGTGSTMTWLDPTADPQHAWQYRVRRECLDSRYVWTSSATTWVPPGGGSPLALRVANPARGVLEFELTGAIGRGVVWLHDLQGRVVARREVDAGEVEVSFPIAIAPAALHAGVYFARVTDSTGRRSRAVKVALLP